MHRGRIIALGSTATLKESLKSYHLMHLDSSDLFESMKALEGAEGILETAVFGSGLHMTVRDPSNGQRHHPGRAFETAHSD